MKRQKDIIINQNQLTVLLSEEEMQSYSYLLEHGVFCTTCMDSCAKGVAVEEVHLDYHNDIKAVGTCRACGGKVARIMEFGEDQDFYKRANRFRESVKP